MIGHSRTGLLVAEDPNDDHYRVLACSKSNLGPKPKSLRFTLDPKEDVCRIGWCGSCGFKATILSSRR